MVPCDVPAIRVQRRNVKRPIALKAFEAHEEPRANESVQRPDEETKRAKISRFDEDGQFTYDLAILQSSQVEMRGAFLPFVRGIIVPVACALKERSKRPRGLLGY